MSKLLRAALPGNTIRAPAQILTREQADAAIAAYKSSAAFANISLPLADGFDMLASQDQQKQARKLFDESVVGLRSELYANPHDDPIRRLEIHHMLMAAGYYSRAADIVSKPHDGVRFVSNHYNFDVRRDQAIVDAVKAGCFQEMKPEQSQLISQLFITERFLHGDRRLVPVGGKQWLLPGINLRLITEEEELKRLLELDPVKADGNFKLSYADQENRVVDVNTIHEKYEAHTVHERWVSATVSCAPETEAPFGMLTSQTTDPHKTTFRMRVLREAPKLSFGERTREFLLQLWVYWFGFWILFWLVDEEVLTLIGLIYARYRQMAVLKEEARRTGGKVYIASGKFL